MACMVLFAASNAVDSNANEDDRNTLEDVNDHRSGPVRVEVRLSLRIRARGEVKTPARKFCPRYQRLTHRAG